MEENPCSFTLAFLASRVSGQLYGEADFRITGLATLLNADRHSLGFIANPAYKSHLLSTKAGAVLCREDMHQYLPPGCHGIVVEDPYLAYAELTSLFSCLPVPEPTVHALAVIDEKAVLGSNVSVGPGAVIEQGAIIGDNSVIGAGCFVGEKVVIGRNVRLHSHVVIYHECSLGDDVVIHSNTVIGADGFGFARSEQGWRKIHQLGAVRIGSRVEIGACSTIDRGALNDTLIGDGVIMDNQVQIAHNVCIGENTAIAACTGIAGSTVIGKNCSIAGAVGIIGHLTICDGVQISAMSLVTRDICEPGLWSGGTGGVSPASLWRKNAVRFSQLDAIYQRLKHLENSQD